MENKRPLTDWLPITRKEVDMRGWDELDVVLISGDAYVDHPAFGNAVIGRIMEDEGLRVAIVAQPNWTDDLRDFKKMGRPRLFFGVSSGCFSCKPNKNERAPITVGHHSVSHRVNIDTMCAMKHQHFRNII